jgi:hypothetical protein
MSSALGQAGFRIGVFVALTSGLLLLVVDRGSAEFVLMVGAFGCASVFLAVLAVLVRFLPKA